MTRAVVVRCRTRPDAADDNERLIKAVFEELAAVRPGGIRYSAFRVDETTFVHTAVFVSDANPLEDLPAFRAFTSGLPGRCAEPPHRRPGASWGSTRRKPVRAAALNVTAADSAGSTGHRR